MEYVALWFIGWWLAAYGLARQFKEFVGDHEWSAHRGQCLFCVLLAPSVVPVVLMGFVFLVVAEMKVKRWVEDVATWFIKSIGLGVVFATVLSGTGRSQELYILKSFSDPNVLAAEAIQTHLKTPGPTHAFESGSSWYTEWHGTEGRRPMVYRLRSADYLTSCKDRKKATDQMVVATCKRGGL